MPQRYERVASTDDVDSPTSPLTPNAERVPNSPPPSFRSRASSPQAGDRRHLLANDPHDADRTLADTFDSPSDDESDDEERNGDDRQRLMRANPQSSSNDDEASQDFVRPGAVERRVTQLPTFVPAAGPGGRVYGGGNNDGVFANLSAKPTRGEDLEEKPPTYEQAAADATPPYWETTILTPGSFSSTDVFVDGLPVGSLFSFIWNAVISMSFQLVGFLLTYLLHTTHAAKNGSRAGLGITLIQFGFSMKGSGLDDSITPGGPDFSGTPPDPNSHDFDPDTIAPGDMPAGSTAGIEWNDWLAYMLMIVGWFILIRSVSDYLRARRHEQLVLQSPDRGLSVPVVAEGERPEQSV